MALTTIVKTLVLDVYDHDQTQATIKAIALDSKTRYVQATLTYMGADYPVSETATVTLTVLRPDKVGAQVVGSVVDVDNADRTGTIKGVFAELTQAALAVRGKKVTGIHVHSYKRFYTGAQYGEFQFGKDTSQRLVFRFAYSNGTWSKWMYVYNDNYVPHGTTAQRPASANTGAFYYDETLKKPLWYYASHWRDSNGDIV